MKMNKRALRNMTNAESIGNISAHKAIGSFFLLFTSPTLLFVIYFMIVHLDASFSLLWQYFCSAGSLVGIVNDISPPFNNLRCWKIICMFSSFELLLMKFSPGKVFKGPVTPSGHQPVYVANGFQSYFISISALFASSYHGLFDPAVVYDNMSSLVSSLNLATILLCLFLMYKGLKFPSTNDLNRNPSVITNFFWGTDLYPQIFGLDIKQFVHCRFGLMSWQLAIICFGFKQYDNLGFLSSSMMVSIVLQTVYIARLFWSETAYFCSLDIQNDFMGYFSCWGSLVWMPAIYTIHTFFLVTHPILLSFPASAIILMAGFSMLWCSYDCEKQRREFLRFCSSRGGGGGEIIIGGGGGGSRSSSSSSSSRDAPGTGLLIWGEPPTYVVAYYVTKNGERKTSYLLTSGWWGLSRCFNYIPEVVMSFCWCVPAMWTHPLPYLYPVYLSIILADRASRENARCFAQYGEDWSEYVQKVPYLLIPCVW